MADKVVLDTDKGSWGDFIRLCLKVQRISSRISKTSAIASFLSSYDGDLKVFLKLMLPKVNQRRFQMNRKRTLKTFANVFNQNIQTLTDLDLTGDISGKIGCIIEHCYGESLSNFPQRNKATILSMKEIDDYLDSLSKLTKESEQLALLKKITRKCNARDLKWFVREIDRDLKIMAGTQTVLDAVDDKAYKTFQTKASLDYIVNKLALGQNLTIGADLLTPIKPMLATACKSYKMAFSKCKSGIIYAEIKYDGERVQIHYDGKEWKFYSRSLKPVTPYKIKDVKDRLVESCPNAKTLILDSEILMVDIKTGKPLPFTSLGKHKRDTFKDAKQCLFVFDILYFNGNSLLNTPMEDRRKILEKEFKEIKNTIHLSNLTIIKTESDLQDLMEEMVNDNQEGLVLKDSRGVYAPNKRHWLKLKRDYLDEGGLADTVDLVVLGAYKGTGKHGGLYSTYLMGCLDNNSNIFKTVCKVHNGLSDEQIQTFTDTLSMIEFDQNNKPMWMDVARSIEPDWIVKNPKKSPIFEITGFEFSESKVHTATDYNGVGVSIRFPRITKIRDDKKYKQATSFQELKELIKTSRDDPLYKNKKKTKKRKTKDEDDDEEKNEQDLEPPTKKRRIDTNNNNNNTNNATPPINNNNNNKNTNNLKIDTKNVSPPPIDIPASPKTMSDNRETCRYDNLCYRQNPDHYKEFQHPQKELSDSNNIRNNTKEKMKNIEKRKQQFVKAAGIAKEKQLKSAQEEYDEIIRKANLAKDKLDSVREKADEQYKGIMNKAQREYDEKMVSIKQNEQFEFEKIEKKYHPGTH